MARTEDEVLRRTGHALYFSSERFFLLWGDWGSPDDGEAGFICDRPIIGNDEGAGQVIKGASEILENVSSYQCEIAPDVEVLRQAVKYVAGFEVLLYNDAAGVRLEPSASKYLEITETMVGPLNL